MAKTRKDFVEEALALGIKLVGGETVPQLKDIIKFQKASLKEAEAAGANKPKAVKAEAKTDFIFQTPDGTDVDPGNYVFPNEEGEVVVSPFFHKVYGYPVDREELIEVFFEVFAPKDEVLFYKKKQNETYTVIIPLAKASISLKTGAQGGDVQVHSMSFITEGSVNSQTLSLKLAAIAKALKYTK